MIARGAGFMRIFVLVVAGLSLVAVCVASGPEMDQTTTASSGVGLYPVLVVHAWRVAWPGALPIGLIFLMGLWVDCWTQGPLGLWALAYVAAAIASDALMGFGRNGVARHAVSITATLILVAGLAWATASLFAWRWLPLGAWAVAAAQAGLVYLMVAGCVVSLRWAVGLRRAKLGEAWP
jgi:cell shape-determining protein MreD